MQPESQLKAGGILISNKSMIDESPARKDIKAVNIPMTAMASSLGNIRCANMIAIGALAARSKMLSIKNVTTALGAAFKDNDELLIRNKKALETGYKW